MRTNKHITQHVGGAIQLMKLRCADSNALVVARPFHRIIWESILYQIFRRAVRYPFTLGSKPDLDFVGRAQEILQILTFPDASVAENSPVIGIPLQLQKLILDIVELCRPGSPTNREVIFELQLQMLHWENMIFRRDSPLRGQTSSCDIRMLSEHAQDFTQQPVTLNILAASLILDWVSQLEELSVECDGILPQAGDSWQVRCALKLMMTNEFSESWVSYLGSWSVLIIGYAVETAEDVAIVRQTLQRTYQLLCLGEEALDLHELESTWEMRGLSPGVPAWLDAIIRDTA